jgi:AcrR family transcriptional regulator
MRRKDETKIDLFYDSTLQLVAQVGLAGLTMPLIAKRSGVATGTIYLYFESKEDLILALHSEISSRFGYTIFLGYDSEKPVEKGFRIVWGNALRYMTENFAEQVFLQQFENSPYRKSLESSAYTDSLMQPLSALIARGQREAVLKADQPRLIQQLFFGFLQQIAADLHRSPGRLTKKYIDTAFRFFWDAVCA